MKTLTNRERMKSLHDDVFVAGGVSSRQESSIIDRISRDLGSSCLSHRGIKLYESCMLESEVREGWKMWLDEDVREARDVYEW